MSTSGGVASPIGTVVTVAAPSGDTNLTCDAATHTFVTTPSVAVGTWLFTAGFLVEAAAAASLFIDFGVAVGTATATLTGNTASGLGFPNSTFDFCTMPVVMSGLAVVTVAGTFIFRYNATGSSPAAVFVGAGGINVNLGVPSALTLIRLA